jgi:fermentation-respiration switch protein FrsA (DUF1100 family)
MKLSGSFASVIVIFSLLTMEISAQSRTEFIGQWNGKLNAGGALLTIVFNVSDSDGELSATMDSPDQGVYGIKVTGIIINNDEISLDVPNVRGKYIGQLDDSWKIINGIWEQAGQKFDLNLAKQKTKSLSPDEIKFDQIYQGKLNAGGFEIRIVLKLYTDESGKLAAFMDSPDQGAKNITVSSLSKTDNELIFSVNSVNGAYNGTIKEDDLIEGVWKQGGQSMELNFNKVDKVEELKRPQTPKKPYPYNEEEVKFRNDTSNVDLAGTVTVPEGEGPFPAVVLVTGSGPQDRDETLFEHKPFLVIADYLTRNGILVLRYDERGVGESSGDFASATTVDFANDAVSAVEFLARRNDVHRDKIGLIGHSEGGLVAIMAAIKSGDLDFIVKLAGPGLPGKEILLMQTELINRAMGTNESDIINELELNKRIYEIVENEPDNEIALKEINSVVMDHLEKLPDSIKSRPEYSKETLQTNLQRITTSWFRFFLSYDPRPDLENIIIPVLALNGEKDLQVPPKENLEAIEKALNTAGNNNFKTVQLKGLNHLFQKSETGAIDEYVKIEETFSEDALEFMKEWILNITK